MDCFAALAMTRCGSMGSFYLLQTAGERAKKML
jgi:hypothetical protein